VFGAPGGLLYGTTWLDQTLAPTAAGTFLYRLCLDINDTSYHRWIGSLANYDLSITSTSPTAVTDIGPDTAVISGWAQACGDLTAVPGHTVRLVATASIQTRWRVYVTDQTPAFTGDSDVLLVDGTSIDQTVALDPEILSVSVCARTPIPGGGPASISFELST
jgi:hypothetical protein